MPFPRRQAAPSLDLPSREHMALRALSHLVEERTGINLRAGQDPHLRGLFLEVGRRSGLRDLEHLFERLDRSPADAELWRACAEVLTTGESFFFRDPGQMELLRARILPDLAARREPIRAWSAGCSRGEEVYTLAILAEEVRVPAGITILGTDLNPAVLSQAEAGVFRPWSFREAEGPWMTRWLEPHQGDWRVQRGLRAKVHFRRHNLVDPDWSSLEGEGPFDLILCRNVFIYFRPAQVQGVVAAFRRLLRPGGYLLVGHGELGLECPSGFCLELHQGSAVYRAEERRQTPRLLEAFTAPAPALAPAGLQALRPSPLVAARAAMNRGEASKALVDLKPLLEAPHPPEEAFQKAVHALANQGRGQEALAKVEEGLRLYPTSASLHHLASLIHADAGHLESSYAAIEQALQLVPRFLPALLDRAQHFEAVGDLAAACSDWTTLRECFEGRPADDHVEGVYGARCGDLLRLTETALLRCGGTR